MHASKPAHRRADHPMACDGDMEATIDRLLDEVMSGLSDSREDLARHTNLCAVRHSIYLACSLPMKWTPVVPIEKVHEFKVPDAAGIADLVRRATVA